MVHDAINNTPVIMYTTKQVTIPTLFLCIFGFETFDIYPYILFLFLKCIFITLVYNIIVEPL